MSVYKTRSSVIHNQKKSINTGLLEYY